jgi:tRNA threonylcarbamoyl adenosine modification protein YeaZ
MSVVLAIDTAAPRLQLALQRADGVVDSSTDDITTGHAEILFDRIRALLARNGLAYQDLTRIAVTTGPGSFTGLRIGLSAARGLGLALSIPVIGVPSLLTISFAAPQDRLIAVLLDARREEAYFQRFIPGAEPEPPAIMPMDQARGLVPSGATLIQSPFVDIGLLVGFAAEADPASFPPDPCYIRDADAKPQEKARIARTRAAS